MNLSNYLKAGYRGLYIETHEPLRAIATISTENWQAFSWDCQRGIIERETGKTVEDITDPLTAIKWLGSKNDTAVKVVAVQEGLRPAPLAEGTSAHPEGQGRGEQDY